MSNKCQSLGYCGSAAAGITASSGTNATPIVATIAPSSTHGLKNGDRVNISGVTGLTAMNGEWSVSAIAATTATLLGSVGNGTFGGTAVITPICDVTPAMRGHAAVVELYTAAFVGTVLVEKGTYVNKDVAGYSGSDPYAVQDFADAKKGLALVATQMIGGFAFEVDMGKYMRLRASAYTSGGIGANLVA